MQRRALLLAALLAAAPLHAQTLRLAGILGGKALMVSGSGTPRAVAPGESIDGVRVVSVGRESVVIESVGGRETLHLGAEPVSVGTHGSAPQQLTLYADARGHFVSGGQINGRPVQYMVDTGATAVSLGRAEAERLGIRVQQGQPVRMQTANGVAEGWRVRLDSVRIGALEQRGVEAIITSEPMPYVLLGNSFLKPYEMTRKGNELLLQKALTMATANADDEYEDLLSQWLDLEAALSMLLLHPALVPEFNARLRQCDQWLQEIVGHDTDAALYLMFQLASTSTAGYSASHALVCATLCQILAQELQLPRHERESLVRAAITMNIAMTALQNQLALQHEPLSSEQKHAVAAHPEKGVAQLEDLNIRDDLWLDVVAAHHATPPVRTTLASLPAESRLTHILATVDRYAAMISPRKSRPGRTASDSVRAIAGQPEQQDDDVAVALMRTVGLCPPGTFVQLSNGDTAVVLRRSERVNFPLVASVADAHGEALAAPVLYHTVRGQPQVAAALARSAVTTNINHHMMVRLGLFAAQAAKPPR